MPNKIRIFDSSIKRKYLIVKGKRKKLEQLITAKIYALSAAAFNNWQSQARGIWSEASTGLRYLESMYWQGGELEATVGIKPNTLGSMLEMGYPEFQMLSRLRGKANAKGKIIIPIGGKGAYIGSPAASWIKIPDDNKLRKKLKENADKPAIMISIVRGYMADKTAENAATSTKPRGRFLPSGKTTSKRGNSFVTVSANTPSHTWKIPAYQGQLLSKKTASYIEQVKDSFFEDIFPRG